MEIRLRTKFSLGERVFYNHKDGESHLGTITAIQYYKCTKGQESLIYTFVSDGGFHKFYVREDSLQKIGFFHKLFSL